MEVGTVKVQNRKKLGSRGRWGSLAYPKHGPIWPLGGVGEGKKQPTDKPHARSLVRPWPKGPANYMTYHARDKSQDPPPATRSYHARLITVPQNQPQNQWQNHGHCSAAIGWPITSVIDAQGVVESSQSTKVHRISRRNGFLWSRGLVRVIYEEKQILVVQRFKVLQKLKIASL